MAIPKTIYQTFKTSKLPLLTKWHIWNLKKKNPEYNYVFFDDKKIDAFIKEEFDEKTYQLYKRINIGAAKADFFRYAILYKRGGIYLDIDSLILKKLDDFILPDDSAIISLEGNLNFFIQYALFFEAGHPFLKKTIETVTKNLIENKYPHKVHKTTGPSAYTFAIKNCLSKSKDIKFRQFDVNYSNLVKFSYP
ncbi:MAG: hypothetical protein JXL97_17950 [Bacteroidales bacterium]|nr:hypothetical protein [Bacteroidales bacterium]